MLFVNFFSSIRCPYPSVSISLCYLQSTEHKIATLYDTFLPKSPLFTNSIVAFCKTHFFRPSRFKPGNSSAKHARPDLKINQLHSITQLAPSLSYSVSFSSSTSSNCQIIKLSIKPQKQLIKTIKRSKMIIEWFRG